MQAYKCDRCGKYSDANYGPKIKRGARELGWLYMSYYDSFEGKREYAELNLCDECSKDFEKWISGAGVIKR